MSLPDVSEALIEWESPYPIKTVTKQTVDFVTNDQVTVGSIEAMIQVADKDSLNPDTIDWSRQYIMVHSRTKLSGGQYIEYNGKDFKLIDDGDWTDYGYSEAIGEETKLPLLVATP